MSALTKSHPTKPHHEAVLRLVGHGRIYHIPKSIAKQYEDRLKTAYRVLPEDIFGDIEKNYTKAGVLLRGTRHREELTQAEMAKKINVTQADLSKMENGKRSIGKVIAKRIEKKFGVNYRYFL